MRCTASSAGQGQRLDPVATIRTDGKGRNPLPAEAQRDASSSTGTVPFEYYVRKRPLQMRSLVSSVASSAIDVPFLHEGRFLGSVVGSVRPGSDEARVDAKTKPCAATVSCAVACAKLLPSHMKSGGELQRLRRWKRRRDCVQAGNAVHRGKQVGCGVAPGLGWCGGDGCPRVLGCGSRHGWYGLCRTWFGRHDTPPCWDWLLDFLYLLQERAWDVLRLDVGVHVPRTSSLSQMARVSHALSNLSSPLFLSFHGCLFPLALGKEAPKGTSRISPWHSCSPLPLPPPPLVPSNLILWLSTSHEGGGEGMLQPPSWGPSPAASRGMGTTRGSVCERGEGGDLKRRAQVWCVSPPWLDARGWPS